VLQYEGEKEWEYSKMQPMNKEEPKEKESGGL